MLASLRTTTILVVLSATAIVSAYGFVASAHGSHKNTARARKAHRRSTKHTRCVARKPKHGHDALANKRQAKHRLSVKCAAVHHRSGRSKTPPALHKRSLSPFYASSALADPPPPPPAPTAGFTYSPASPQVGQPVEFNASSSTCPDGPCTYEWSDDGGPTQPLPAQWPLGSGQTMTFTFHEAATKYVRLLLTDVLGRIATVERNVVVSPEPPPPPPAPTAGFTYSPASPQVGQPVEFNASSSTCPDGPCTYEWSDDGGPTQPLPAQWPLGSGQTMTFTFHEAATKYVRLLLTDVLGETVTAEQNVVVSPEQSPPPPPSPPTNTAVPTVSGTAQVGQTLTAHNGTWSGTTPITYTRQWQSEGANIAGATSSTYTPVTADVEHTLDVVVTAHNSAGSGSATSAQTAVVTNEAVPPAPTASFTYSPTSPEVGQSVKFDATGSTCPDGPCTYEWSNDGSPVQPIPPQFPLGSGQTISLKFSSAGTKYMRLLVADLLGRTATVEHNVTVEPEPPPPPPPTPPSNTSAPTVSGAAQVGQTLTAHNGTWSGTTPITYTYQWQRSATNITGASGSTYTPVTADVEHTLDIVVTAHNSAGSESATSAPTAAVTKAEGGQQTNCINDPSSCGYPDATNTGVPAGTTLTPRSGDVSVTAAGTTVKDLAVTGEILVEANNTTVVDDEVIASSGSGNRGIYIAPGVTGTVIDHVTCHGEGKGSQYCVFNKNSSTKIEHSYLYNCGECLNGPGTITDSFFDVTAVISGEHYEDIYYGGGEGPLIVNHDTMLNPQGQTATVFASTDFGNQTTLTITNNLLAGGGYTLYGGASCTTGGCGAVNGPVTVTGNRFSNKYYPESGYYGIGAYFNNAVTTWSGNFWDGTLKSVPEPSP